MARKHIAAVAAVSALLLAGCSAGEAPAEEVSGELTVITHRTDLVDSVFQEYKAAFEKKYPEVTVKFEAITDYEGEISIRLTSGDYGDVLVIPNTVKKDQLATFFEPLGTVADLKPKYNFIEEQAYDGTVYGIAIVGNAQGVLVNQKVWAAAGITEPPKSPEEFLAGLQAIKASTDAIPLYTNYKDGWPLSQWEGNRGITGDPDASLKLTQNDTPWAAGSYHDVVDSILFDAVAGGLTEADPLTTNWEESKGLLATGKVGTAVLGSWAIVQFQDAAEAAGLPREDVAYWPFPYQVDGKFYSTAGGDYKQAISVNSKNKAAARAWIDWFNAESGFSVSQGGISPIIGGENPASLQAFLDVPGVTLITLNPAPAGHEADEDNIRSESEIDLWGNIYRQKLVDIARGAASGTKDSYFAELNKRWADARAKVLG